MKRTRFTDEPSSTAADVPSSKAAIEQTRPDSPSGSKRHSKFKEFYVNDFKRNVDRLSHAHKYFSRLDLSSLKGKSKEISEGVSEKVQQLEKEKKVLQDELVATKERIRALSVEVEAKDLELTALAPKLKVTLVLSLVWRD